MRLYSKLGERMRLPQCPSDHQRWVEMDLGVHPAELSAKVHLSEQGQRLTGPTPQSFSGRRKLDELLS